MNIAYSLNNIPIRLTDERWRHIVENHEDMAGHYDAVLQTVEDADYVIKGYGEALIALREIKRNKFLTVVYKEFDGDGFIITAYFTSKLKLEREKILWKKK